MPKGLEQVPDVFQGVHDHQLSSKTEELKKQLDEAVPNVPKAIQAVHDHQSFSKTVALQVFYNRPGLALPKIDDLKEVEFISPNRALEETFRREKGLEFLKSLGTNSHKRWEGVLMTKSSFEFLEQLVQALAKDRKITPRDKTSKEWFRTEFICFKTKTGLMVKI